MKKFIIYLLVIVVAVSLGFAVFFLVRDNEVISISNATIYKDAGSQPFTIDVNHYNKKSYTKIDVSVSDDNIVSYDSKNNNFTAKSGGVARVNFRTTNAKFRNLWCDVIVGDGTEESPFYVSTPEQLAAIGRGVADANGVFAGSDDYPQYTSNACYKLVADIDVKDVNNGYWIPLRNFSGRLDGNGFTIKNVNIDRDSYIAFAAQESNTFDPNIFSKENAGFFQRITSTGMVYNLKLEVYANGRYNNFGTIAAINEGLIERVEVKSAFLSVETESTATESGIFGGLVAKNITTESGENDTYDRHIARIDRCSINMTLGKKIVDVDGVPTEAVLGINNTIGGLVGVNEGGAILYSYATGEVAFAKDNNNSIVYGGLVAENRYATLTQYGNNYTTQYQGANIKDSYSNLITNLQETPVNADTRIAGAIAKNIDFSHKDYDANPDKKEVQNYIIGVYYNKENLNKEQENIAKNYIGIAEFTCNSTVIPYQDEKMIVYGLTATEMTIANNYDSHNNYEIKFDDQGQSQGLEVVPVKWLFGTVWSMEVGVNNDMPFLNYQLVYIPDDFRLAGTPIVLEQNRYVFEMGDADFPIKIVSGTNGRLYIMKGESYDIKITPAGVETEWVSSDPTTVSVDPKTGRITANNTGTATITAQTKSGSVDSITVIVSDKSYVIDNYPTEITLVAGQTHQLNVVSTPATTLEYISDDNTIVSVNSNGLITAVAKGTTYITIRAGVTEVKVKVEVKENTSSNVSVAINLANAQVVDNNFTQSYIGNVQITSAIANGNDIKGQLSFAYKSNNTNVVTINSTTGAYTVIGTGKATIDITITTAGYVGSAYMFFDISSSTASTETLVFNHTSYSLYVGGTLQLSWSGTTQTPTLSSDNSSVATISSSGLITAISKGQANIRGMIQRADGTYATAVCYITVDNKVPMVITITPNNPKIKINTTQALQATANVSTGFAWKVSDATMAELIDNGANATITMKKVGKVTVIVTSTVDSSASASIVVEGYDPVNLTNGDIYNYEQLNNIRHHLDGEFRLCADIDMSGLDWEPIGSRTQPFTGKLTNAGNYTIKNLSNANGGLFGYLKDATISDIRVDKFNISASVVGTIANIAYNSTINNCTISNSSISSTESAGGVVGRLTDRSVIENCSVIGNTLITATGQGTKCVGGIAGENKASQIANCYVSTTNTISLGSNSKGYVGGIAGYANSSIEKSVVENATIIANNTDSDYAGGIVGYTTSSVLNSIIQKASITGYYAGGIGGAINVNRTVTLKFTDFKSGYRKSDLSMSNYEANVNCVAVKEGVNVKGNHVGGLFGVIQSGVVMNSYTRATLTGNANNAIVAGFASLIKSSGFNNEGGSGHAGIVENCYAACKFAGSGDKYAITSSLVHNYATFGAGNDRIEGYCFNYLFDDDIDGKATYKHGSNLFGKDNVLARKSTSEMKTASTYINKGFMSGYWTFAGDYAILNIEL